MPTLDSSAAPDQPQRPLRFTAEQRLRRPDEFEVVYKARHRASDARLLIFGLRRGAGPTRIGLSVGRKHGNAVRRARLKRLLREAFRLSQYELPQGLDLVLIPQQGTSSGVAEFRESLRRLVPQLEKRLERQARATAGPRHGPEEAAS